MKLIKVRDLAKCPVCGSKAFLRKNASKDFQVACTKCKCRTIWTTKPNALVQWYNMTLQILRNNGEIVARED